MTDWNARSFHGTHNRYPFTDVVSFVLRNFGNAPDRSQVSILDLGCGGGAHLAFLLSEGFDAYGVDGNEDSVLRANERIRELGLPENRATAADFACLPYNSEKFDAVIDRGALTCNEGKSIRPLLTEIRRVLKPGATVMSMLLDECAAGEAGGRSIGGGDYVDFPGRLAHAGLLHFTTPSSARQIFSDFQIHSVERLVRTTVSEKGDSVVNEAWVVVTAHNGTTPQ